MINYSNATIEKISLHKVGNKINDNQPELSDSPLRIDSLISSVLSTFFLEPFYKIYNCQRFSHPSNLKYNTCYKILKQIFNEDTSFHNLSIELANYLFDKSSNHFIKKGEFYTVYFKDFVFEDKMVDAVGLFKSENKEKFIKVYHQKKKFNLEIDEGIDIHKLDKGALILNCYKDEGYRILSIDNTNKKNEAQYWVNEFLGIELAADSFNNTQNLLSLTKEFIVNGLQDEFEVTKIEQLEYLNRSAEYFQMNDHYKEKDFAKEVFHHNNLINSFQRFRNRFVDENDLSVSNDFPISNIAVKKQKSFFKSVIKLDKNFHIYVHGNRDMIEQGYDSKNGKKYYKIYFDKET